VTTTTLLSATCVRFYSTGPEYHIDSQHATFGLIDTSEQPTIDDAGYLIVKFLDIGPRKVGSMTAASDETLTANGISAGCSNGGPYARIRFYKDGVGALNLKNSAHWALLDGPNANMWFTAAHEIPALPEPVDLDDLVTPATLATLRLRDILALRVLGDALEQQ